MWWTVLLAICAVILRGGGEEIERAGRKVVLYQLNQTVENGLEERYNVVENRRSVVEEGRSNSKYVPFNSMTFNSKDITPDKSWTSKIEKWNEETSTKSWWDLPRKGSKKKPNRRKPSKKKWQTKTKNNSKNKINKDKTEESQLSTWFPVHNTEATTTKTTQSYFDRPIVYPEQPKVTTQKSLQKFATQSRRTTTIEPPQINPLTTSNNIITSSLGNSIFYPKKETTTSKINATKPKKLPTLSEVADLFDRYFILTANYPWNMSFEKQNKIFIKILEDYIANKQNLKKNHEKLIQFLRRKIYLYDKSVDNQALNFHLYKRYNFIVSDLINKNINDLKAEHKHKAKTTPAPLTVTDTYFSATTSSSNIHHKLTKPINRNKNRNPYKKPSKHYISLRNKFVDRLTTAAPRQTTPRTSSTTTTGTTSTAPNTIKTNPSKDYKKKVKRPQMRWKPGRTPNTPLKKNPDNEGSPHYPQNAYWPNKWTDNESIQLVKGQISSNLPTRPNFGKYQDSNIPSVNLIFGVPFTEVKKGVSGM